MAGFRTFATGEVLTAANVNNFLMKQSVMVFADAAARTAALGAEVAEGMLTFNLDTGQLEVFDGTDFVEPAPEPPAGIGSNVVSVTKTDVFTMTSTTFTTVPGLSVTITPSSSSSKILVLGNIQASGRINRGTYQRLMRGNTPIGIGDARGSSLRVGTAAVRENVVGPNNQYDVYAVNLLDTPNTTSPVTYSIQIAYSATSEGPACINRLFLDNDVTGILRAQRAASTLTVIEVSA